MNSTTYLEWWHDGAWRRIGWPASSSVEVDKLRAHGARLAATGGYYRLVTPSVYADAPPTVLHEYPVVDPAAGPAVATVVAR